MLWDRRAFVRAAGMGVMGAALPACASVAALRVPAAGGVVRLDPAAHPALATPGGVLKVQAEGAASPFYVVRTGDDYIALSAVCQHLGCIVNERGGRFVCPCHGSTYSPEGQVLKGPTQRPLVRHRLERDADGTLVIALGELS